MIEKNVKDRNEGDGKIYENANNSYRIKIRERIKKNKAPHTHRKKKRNNFLISIPEMCIFFSIFSTPNIIFERIFFSARSCIHILRYLIEIGSDCNIKAEIIKNISFFY